MKGTLRAITLLAVLPPTMLSAVTVTVYVGPTHCGEPDGSATAVASGGLPPYTYSWSNGAITASIGGLLAGDYTVTVTDGLTNTAQATGTVYDQPNLNLVTNITTMQPDCAGGCTGWVQIIEADLGGTSPYTYTWPNPILQGGTASFMGVCAWQSQQVLATDALGCTGTFDLYVAGAPWGQPNIMDNVPACGGLANGSITISGGGGWAYFRVNPIGGGTVLDFELFDPPWTLSGLAAGDYEVLYWNPIGEPPFFQPSAVYCTVPTEFTISSMPPPCGSISGTVYHDADQDCIFNGADLKLPYKVLSIEPGGEYAITDGNGAYSQNLNYGNHTIEQPLVNEVQLCPPTNPTAFIIDAGSPDAVVDMADSSTVPADVGVGLWHWDARPGFPTQVSVVVTNWTAYPSGNVSVDLTYDPLLLNPVPASGHWDLGVMTPYSQQSLYFSAQVPANINLLGTVLNYAATITNSGPDANAANNTVPVDVTITGSYDPNDKRGRTSSGLGDTQYFLNEDDWIDYTVRFQNTGTAAADVVVIRDTIDADLDIPSLEILGASHAFTPSFGQGRELVFSFNDINLPDSTTDLLGSQGFISYRIKPDSDVIVGTVLDNTAGIYFDFNPPIITNTVTHVVDFSTDMVRPTPTDRELRVFPNPASDRIRILPCAGRIQLLRIHAADGRMVLSSNAQDPEVDISGLRPGVYMLDATFYDGRIAHAQFIVQ